MKQIFYFIAIVALFGALLSSCKPEKDNDIRYMLTIRANNDAWGRVTGNGTYSMGDSVSIAAVPAEGYYFICWDDGISLNPRTVVINGKATYVAIFSSDADNTVSTVGFDENGASVALFSVSDTSQVRFSCGNLQYMAAYDIWRFAKHQYDRVGNDNCFISTTYDGWIDLFGWGTGDNPTNSSGGDADYPMYTDWGSNTIYSGSIATTGWRTLTIKEWTYLIQKRTDASLKYGTGNIDGLGGIILLPDDWVLPDGYTFNAGVASSGYDYTHNAFTKAQWSVLEAAGAVFLPAAGYRYGKRVDDVGRGGHYWSSSVVSWQEYTANYMGFASSICHFGSEYRFTGSSVRLVKEE